MHRSSNAASPWPDNCIASSNYCTPNSYTNVASGTLNGYNNVGAPNSTMTFVGYGSQYCSHSFSNPAISTPSVNHMNYGPIHASTGFINPLVST